MKQGAGLGVGMLSGAGDPFLDFFWDLEISQDSTIVKFRFLPKRVGGADRFGDTKFQNYSSKSQ